MIDDGPQLNARCRPEVADDLPRRPIGPFSKQDVTTVIGQDFKPSVQLSQGWQEVQEQERAIINYRFEPQLHPSLLLSFCSASAQL